jgi:hypothetical protein
MFLLQAQLHGRAASSDQGPGLLRCGKETAVQRKERGAPAAFPLLPTGGAGRPLDASVRAKMEAAFGADFSAVRIYEGPEAASIGALAVTRGHDIFFAPGRYQPDSKPGRVRSVGTCTENDSCEDLAVKLAAFTAEISARVLLNSTCFRGGDAGHQVAVNDNVGALNRCYSHFDKQNCNNQLKQRVAQVVAAVQNAANSVGSTASKYALAAADAAGDLLNNLGAGAAALGGGVLLLLQSLVGWGREAV